ncbi:MAG: M42 family metallopeptidase [Synergistaceae bacterium]
MGKIDKLLNDLLGANGPSGCEDSAAKVFQTNAGLYTYKTYKDIHGNVHADLKIPDANKPTILLTAHMDEIGLMITEIDKEGFLKILGVGGWDSQILQGQRVIIKTDSKDVYGVIGKKPIHLMDDKDKDHAVKMKDLWIDIGAKNKKEAEKQVRLGDTAVIDVKPILLNNDLIVSKSLDNRAGCYVILKALEILSKKKLKCNVHVMGSVQEEIGLNGIVTGGYLTNPQVGFVVDVTFAMDHPNCSGDGRGGGDIKLGKGPSIARGPVLNPSLFSITESIAKRKRIPYQIEPCPSRTWTDTDGLQLVRGGVACSLISIPLRYMHSPVEIVNMKDLDNTAKLIAESVVAVGEKPGFLKV